MPSRDWSTLTHEEIANLNEEEAAEYDAWELSSGHQMIGDAAAAIGVAHLDLFFGICDAMRRPAIPALPAAKLIS